VLGWATLFAAGIGGYLIAKSRLDAERKEALQKGLRKPPPQIKSWDQVKQEERLAAQKAKTSQDSISAGIMDKKS